jgi:membrane protein DedA with SNARE-associated domain
MKDFLTKNGYILSWISATVVGTIGAVLTFVPSIHLTTAQHSAITYLAGVLAVAIVLGYSKVQDYIGKRDHEKNAAAIAVNTTKIEGGK